MHWPEWGVASISRSSAFISSAVSRRPARTLPWQAMVEHTAARRCSSRLPPPRPRLAIASRARSRTRPLTSVSPSSAGTSRTITAPGPNASSTSPSSPTRRRRLGQRRGLVGVELDDLGDQQHLARHAAVGQRRLQALVDQALVRGVLVDDHHASRASAPRCRSRAAARAPRPAGGRAGPPAPARLPARASALGAARPSSGACQSSANPRVAPLRCGIGRRVRSACPAPEAGPARNRQERTARTRRRRARQRLQRQRAAARRGAVAGRLQRLAQRAGNQAAHARRHRGSAPRPCSGAR